MTSISTRTGDDGTTALMFNRRVPKNHPRVVACGAVDELMAAIGLSRASASDADTAGKLYVEQQCLIGIMGELSTDDADRARLLASKLQRLLPEDLARLDGLVAALEARRLRIDGWDIPGASLHHGHLHQARATCRRAERELVNLRASGATVPELMGHYLNRLSDVLFLWASAERNRVGIDPQDK
jgi:cob(I)alamin adenosyltransferase